MFWNDETPVYVYGAGLNGKMIGTLLKRGGFKICGYFDRTAEQIKEIDGLPVFRAEKLAEEERRESIIVLGVLNVFEHEEIAVYLLKLGYQFIIFKSIKGKFEEDNNILFDLISLNAVDPEFNSYKYIHDEIIKIPINKNIINESREISGSEMQIKEIGGFISVEVPLIFMYTKSKQVYMALSKDEHEKDILRPRPYDSNLCYYFYSKDLYKLFDEDLDYDKVVFILKRYYEYFCKFNTYPADLIKEKFKAHLSQRYSIYRYMKEMLYEYPDFFKKNAPILRWDKKKNYLYLVDGANRCAFLKQKQYRKFICRMSKSDYCKWINRVKLIQFIEEMGGKSNAVSYSDENIVEIYLKVLLGNEKDFLLKKEMAVLEYLGDIMFFEDKHNCMFFSDEIVLHNVFEKMQQSVWVSSSSVGSKNIYEKKAELLYMNQYEFVTHDRIHKADYIYISAEHTANSVESLIGLLNEEGNNKLLMQEVETEQVDKAKFFLHQMGWQIRKVLYFFSQKKIAVIIAGLGGKYDEFI